MALPPPTRISVLVFVSFALAALAALPGCTEKLTPPTGGGGDPDAPVAMRPVIPDSIQTIFTDNCAVPFCHVPGPAFGGEILDADSSYARTVGVRSVQDPQLNRIEPGNAADSYLIRKIDGGPDIVNSQMPLGELPLSREVRDRIRNWVNQGAIPDSIPADSSRLGPGRVARR